MRVARLSSQIWHVVVITPLWIETPDGTIIRGAHGISGKIIAKSQIGVCVYLFQFISI